MSQVSGKIQQFPKAQKRANPNVKVIFEPLLILMFTNISLAKVSQVKFRIKEWRNRLQFLMGGAAKCCCHFFFQSAIRAESALYSY